MVVLLHYSFAPAEVLYGEKAALVEAQSHLSILPWFLASVLGHAHIVHELSPER